MKPLAQQGAIIKKRPSGSNDPHCLFDRLRIQNENASLSQNCQCDRHDSRPGLKIRTYHPTQQCRRVSFNKVRRISRSAAQCIVGAVVDSLILLFYSGTHQGKISPPSFCIMALVFSHKEWSNCGKNICRLVIHGTWHVVACKQKRWSTFHSK